MSSLQRGSLASFLSTLRPGTCTHTYTQSEHEEQYVAASLYGREHPRLAVLPLALLALPRCITSATLRCYNHGHWAFLAGHYRYQLAGG